MRELSLEESAAISGGRDISPGSCSLPSVFKATAFGALAGIPGFAGGPVAGFSGMLFTASIGGIVALDTCARDYIAQMGH
jgi:hypothetical protein